VVVAGGEREDPADGLDDGLDDFTDELDDDFADGLGTAAVGLSPVGDEAKLGAEVWGWGSAASPDAVRFTGVCARTMDAIISYCGRRLASRDDVDDAVSEVFFVAWRRRSDLFAADSPLAWLYAVARGVVGNHLRAGRRRSRLVDHVGRSAAANTVPDIAERVAIEADARLDAAGLLERLAPVDREILRLLAWKGLSLKEIAEETGMAEGTVRSRLYRMRKTFAQDRAVVRGPDASGRAPS